MFMNQEIKTEALDFLQLPVDIKSGFIGELNIRVCGHFVRFIRRFLGRRLAESLRK